jgi:hypothetical protein
MSDYLPEFAVQFVKRETINSMASTAPQIPQLPQTAIYPTPPPLSCHAFENNDVTSIMT